MPLPNNGFKWRPNDNSSQTNLRYTLEAEKWVNAVSVAQRKNQPRSFGKDLAIIGMIFQLVFSIILLIILGILTLIKSIIYFIESKTTAGTISGEANYASQSKLGGDRSLLGYIFYNRCEELRDIWKFIYYTVFIFIIEIVVLYFLSEIWPEHIRFYRDTVIFAAGVSLFFAFTGMGD